ncbi:MAG: acyl carrier protein [Candidatus Latescibacteria bacterium]|jgi:acyl carrier protein|nr:acyl carrier protein [Candidatus Latescibacterota bacterium]
MSVHDILSRIRPSRKEYIPVLTLEDELRALFDELSSWDVSGIGLDDDLVLDFGLDSLSCLELLAEVEKRFDVRFPDEHLGQFRTLREILKVIRIEERSDQL